MQIRDTYKRLVMLALSMSLAIGAIAQTTVGPIYSPYSLYGIGELQTQGTAVTQAMGGVSLGMRNPFTMNNTNPAAFSAVAAQTFLLNFGMNGQNNYLSSETSKSSRNYFGLGDLGVMFPLTKGIGFGMSLTPFSSVGYKTLLSETDPDIISKIGKVDYEYTGEGGISVYKFGIGAKVFKGLSLGANLIYYIGNINRYSQTTVTPIVSNQEYRTVMMTNSRRVRQVNYELGMQYNIDFGKERNLNFAFVYQPKVKTVFHDQMYMDVAGAVAHDSIFHSSGKGGFVIPTKIGAGVFYTSPKISFGVDYNRQNWNNSFEINPQDNIALTASQDIRIGLQYVPNRFDVRRFMNRCTYRAGFRYEESYLSMSGHDRKGYAVTMGIGIPVQRNGLSLVNIGAEFGQNGMKKYGLVKDTYFKLSVGFSIFSTQEWFVRHKFK